MHEAPAFLGSSAGGIAFVAALAIVAFVAGVAVGRAWAARRRAARHPESGERKSGSIPPRALRFGG